MSGVDLQKHGLPERPPTWFSTGCGVLVAIPFFIIYFALMLRLAVALWP